MTQTAEQVEMQAAVEEAFVEFVATHTAYHRNSDALPSHAVTLCPQWPKLTQTIRTALALAAAEGAYEGLRSVWQQPDAVTFSTLLGRVIAAQQKAEAEIERRRGELVKCSS